MFAWHSAGGRQCWLVRCSAMFWQTSLSLTPTGHWLQLRRRRRRFNFRTVPLASVCLCGLLLLFRPSVCALFACPHWRHQWRNPSRKYLPGLPYSRSLLSLKMDPPLLLRPSTLGLRCHQSQRYYLRSHQRHHHQKLTQQPQPVPNNLVLQRLLSKLPVENHP